jgi:hypothetical protein
VSTFSSELGIARHRILIGDSNSENGNLSFDRLSNLSFFEEKYWFTTSASDRNQNLIQTKL